MDDNKITVIEAAHYEQDRQRLMADPIIIAMAKGMSGPRTQFAHEGTDTPHHAFMLAANAEYERRMQVAGREPDAKSLGAVPEALIRLYDAERAAANEAAQKAIAERAVIVKGADIDALREAIARMDAYAEAQMNVDCGAPVDGWVAYDANMADMQAEIAEIAGAIVREVEGQ